MTMFCAISDQISAAEPEHIVIDRTTAYNWDTSPGKEFELEASYDDHGQGGAWWDTTIRVTQNDKLISELALFRIGAMYCVNSRHSQQALCDLIIVEFDYFNVGAYTISSSGVLQELVNIETTSDNRHYGLIDIDNDGRLELVFAGNSVYFWDSTAHGKSLRGLEAPSDPEISLLVFELFDELEHPVRTFGLFERK